MAGSNPGTVDLVDLMSTPAPAPTTSGSSLLSGSGILSGRFQKGGKRPTTLQIPKDALGVTTNAAPTPGSTTSKAPKSVKGPVSYSQLAQRLHELASGADQKTAQRQLVESVFPRLAVYSSVDPGLSPSLLTLLQSTDDRTVLRYTYYYLGRVLAESPNAEGATPGRGVGGGIPTPDWDALAVMEGGTSKRSDIVPKIVAQLAAESSAGGDGTGEKPAAHARRVAALKALVSAPDTPDVKGTVQQVVLGILDKVSDMGKLKRKKGLFGRNSVDKDQALRSNLQYAALAALRRLPLEANNPVFLTRSVQGLGCADPVGVRHGLAMLSQLALVNPVAVGMAVSPQGAGASLVDSLGVPDTLGRVYLARLCSTLVLCPQLSSRVDITAVPKSILFQLLLDQSEKVCLEAIAGVAGSFGGEGTVDQRASGWALLCSATMEVSAGPGAPKGSPGETPDDKLVDVLKVAVQRMDLILRSQSRPALHAAVRVAAELGKSRAAAQATSGGRGSVPAAPVDDVGAIGKLMGNDAASLAGSGVDRPAFPRGKREQEVNLLLGVLMEAVRTVVACECVYVRAAALKAMIWMQGPDETADELKASMAGELSDASWSASLLNELLLTLHSRFKATPSMAVTLLDVAGLFVTLVPGKLDSDVLQLLWKHCLVGCGPEGKRTALEAVSVVLDLPPPPPPSSSQLSSVTSRSSTSDPRSAIALQRLVLAAVWFLGENANYAAAEYAWEPGAPTAALMMMEGPALVAAAGSRNPALAAALARLERCALSSSWEVRVVATQALMTVAIRSGEPYRLQVYEFFHGLLYGASREHIRTEAESEVGAVTGGGGSGEDPGATGTGLAFVVGPMIKMLDEMYLGQEQLMRDEREHKNKQVEWTDEELTTLAQAHERLINLVSLFCFVPRSKYLPLGPSSLQWLEKYREKFGTPVQPTRQDPAFAAGIADLLNFTGGGADFTSVAPPPGMQSGNSSPQGGSRRGSMSIKDYSAYDWSGTPPGIELVNDFLGGDGGEEEEGAEGSTAPVVVPAYNYEDLWATTMLEASDDETEKRSRYGGNSSGSSSPETPRSPQGYAAVQQFTTEQAAALFDSPNDDPLSRWESTWNTGGSASINSNSKTSRFSNDYDNPPRTESPILKALKTRRSDEVGASESRSRSSSIGGDMSARRVLDSDFFSSGGGFGADVSSPASTNVTSSIPQNASSSVVGKGSALYDFSSGGDDELSLDAGDELEIQYEIDGWYMVNKKVPGPDGKTTGLVPVLYVNTHK